MAMGEFARVEKHLQDALERSGVQVADWEVLSLLVDAAARRRDLDALEEHVAAAEASARKFNQTLHLGVVYRSKGVAHLLKEEWDKSRKQFLHALSLFQEMDARWQVGQTQLELGTLAASRYDYDEARANWVAALDQFELMGADPDAARTREMLASLP